MGSKRAVLALFSIPIAIVIPVITALTSKQFVEMLSVGTEHLRFAGTMAMMCGMLFLFSGCKHAMKEHLEAFQQSISIHYASEAFEKLLSLDYEILESYDGRAKFERCREFAMRGSQSDGAWAIVRMLGLIESIFGIFTYLAILAWAHPLLVGVILLTCLLEFFVYQAAVKIARQTEEEMVHSELRFSYFFRLATDIAAGKDIRLNGAAKWLCEHLNRSVVAYTRIMRWYTNETTKLTMWQVLCAFVRDVAAFTFLIIGILQNTLDVSDFVFCFGLVTGFSAWINGISGHISSLKRISIECQKYREFMDLGNDKEDGEAEGRDSVSISSVESIEFRDVCFSYETGGQILDHLNFAVKRGERIAIVGENGAGKTTMIKLLCGLYTPTAGKIVVNGKDLTTISKKNYFDLLSGIFQDYTVLPASIQDNITVNTSSSQEEVWEVLEKVGLQEKVSSLKLGLDTKLNSQLSSDAVNLSGGETQRLLFARALYKDASILILDEPTAFLDPIAEEALYLQYQTVTKDKISFFVSHRLTSTQFCDKIFFLQDGKIVESGSHAELIENRGEYWKMFQIQGFYYQKEASI